MKQAANMASRASTPKDDWTGRRIDTRESGRRIAVRKAEVRQPDPPRNAGEHRTAGKPALLKTIEDLGGEW